MIRESAIRMYTDGFREFGALYWHHPDGSGSYQFLDRSGSVVTWPKESFENRFHLLIPDESTVRLNELRAHLKINPEICINAGRGFSSEKENSRGYSEDHFSSTGGRYILLVGDQVLSLDHKLSGVSIMLLS